jgi:3'-phosphoadenosine 5'-phosphosulfate sulfotransferase (PAPS reductase)/FAD synthetase
VVQFVAREGKDAMYKSIELRKACCGIRKMEPLARALAGKKPGSPACAGSSRAPAPTCR